MTDVESTLTIWEGVLVPLLLLVGFFAAMIVVRRVGERRDLVAESSERRESGRVPGQ